MFVSQSSGGDKGVDHIRRAVAEIHDLRALNAPVEIREIIELNRELDRESVAEEQKERLARLCLGNGRGGEAKRSK